MGQEHTGAALRRQRQTAGLTLEQLASAAHVQPALLEHYELGLRNPGDPWTGHVHRVANELVRQVVKP